MDTYKLKWTALQYELFRFLCVQTGQSFNVRGIARHLEKSPTAVSKALEVLKKDGIVNVEEYKGKANILSIELNRDSKKVIRLKKAENLKFIYESGLVEFLEEELPATTIVLFGSYSKGEDLIESDIDIAVIGSKEKKIKLTKFDKALQRIIFLHLFEDLNKIDKNLKQNIINGIILKGNLEI